MRFFFDNNLSPYLARAIGELCRPDGTEVAPLADKFPRDTADSEWIAALGAEGDWSIISHDRFAKNDLEKEAFRRSGLTAFILSKTWSNHQEWDKAWHLVRWWPRIMDQAALVEGGAAFEVPVRFSGKGRFRQVAL